MRPHGGRRDNRYGPHDKFSRAREERPAARLEFVDTLHAYVIPDDVITVYNIHPAPSARTRWDVHAWLLERGCELATHRVYRGCDGLWRGSGVEVVRG